MGKKKATNEKLRIALAMNAEYGNIFEVQLIEQILKESNGDVNRAREVLRFLYEDGHHNLGSLLTS